MSLDRIDMKDIRGPVYITPLSNISFVIYHLLKRNGIQILGFCDNNPSYMGKEYDGCYIFTPDIAYAKNPDASFIIASFNYRKELNDQLQLLGSNHLIYAGQFLEPVSFLEALNELDESPIHELVDAYSSPKRDSCISFRFFYKPTPSFDTNLNLCNSLELFPYYLPFSNFYSVFDEASSAYDCIWHVKIYVESHSDMTELPSLLSHILGSNCIVGLITVAFIEVTPNSLELQSETCEKLSQNEFDFIPGRTAKHLYTEKDLDHPLCITHIVQYCSPFEESLRCFFIHIPKNAGTSINQAIFRTMMFDHHKRALHCMEYDSLRFQEYFTFSIVRNPWDRLVSSYHYGMRKLLECSHRRPSHNKRMNPQTTFRQYVYAMTSSISPNDFQYPWVCDKNGRILVDYIGRFENLKDSFAYIANKLGIPSSRLLPHENASNHKNYIEYYDDELIELVQKIFRKDIELFGYEFGKPAGSDIVINPRHDFIPNAL